MLPPVRARDLRTNIKELGFENGTVATLEQLLEEFSVLRNHLRELTNLVSRCIDEVDKLNHLDDGLRAKIEQIERDRGSHGEDNQ